MEKFQLNEERSQVRLFSNFSFFTDVFLAEPGSEAVRTPRAPAESKKGIKYPIEDLDLDPRTIHDGRVLRRLVADIPPLPTKPVPIKKLIVPAEYFDDVLMIWNLLNIFS